MCVGAVVVSIDCSNLTTSVCRVHCRYYFVEGHALNDRPRLAKVVAEKLETMLEEPPSANELLDFLNGNEGRKEIEEALQTLDQMGIHGIPKFIIEGRTIVDGAAQSEVFVENLSRD